MINLLQDGGGDAGQKIRIQVLSKDFEAATEEGCREQLPPEVSTGLEGGRSGEECFANVAGLVDVSSVRP